MTGSKNRITYFCAPNHNEKDECFDIITENLTTDKNEEFYHFASKTERRRAATTKKKINDFSTLVRMNKLSCNGCAS